MSAFGGQNAVFPAKPVGINAARSQRIVLFVVYQQIELLLTEEHVQTGTNDYSVRGKRSKG